MEAYKEFWSDRSHVKASVVGFVLLVVSLFVNYFAGVYATERASNPVTDIILSNTKALDLDNLFVWCSWSLVLLIGVICAKYPKRMPFVFKSIAVFVIIRAVFISLTHIGPFPNADIINPSSFINYFVFGGDLFFSGHTGLPFLMALIFWDKRPLRYLFIMISVFLAGIVLLAHLHYTIDVASAYFITYGIYKISEKLFRKDFNLAYPRA